MRTSDQLKELYKLPLNWEKLSGSKILVAGASGLIGSALVKALVTNPKRTYKVWALGRDIGRLNSVFSEYIKYDLNLIEADLMHGLNSDVKFDYIIDCASNANPMSFSKYPVETILGNVLGVHTLLRYGVKTGLSRFLYISSGEIYGEGTQDYFVESDSGYVDCLSVRACYPCSKRSAENLCIAYGYEYGVDVVIARPCHIYGPGFLKTDDRAYAQFFTQAAKNKDIILKSSGLLNRSWCYIRDCVAALLYILINGEKNEAYNISDESMTIRDFATMIAKEAHVKITFEIPENVDSPIITKGILCAKKLKNLGWTPLDDIKANIKSTLEELR